MLYHVSVFHSFLLLNNNSVLCLYHILSGHLGCFHFLAIINNVAMNIQVQVFIWTNVFSYLGQISRSRIGWSYGNSCSAF